jgi:hypothetical protein
VDSLLEFNSLKDDVDGSSRNVNFLNHKLRRIFVVFSTTNFLSEDLDVCFLTDWKSVLSSLLSMKVVYICNQKFFNNLVVTLQDIIIILIFLLKILVKKDPFWTSIKKTF